MDRTMDREFHEKLERPRRRPEARWADAAGGPPRDASRRFERRSIVARSAINP